MRYEVFYIWMWVGDIQTTAHDNTWTQYLGICSHIKCIHNKREQKELLETWEAERYGTHWPLEPAETAQSCQYLNFELLASRTVREYISVKTHTHTNTYNNPVPCSLCFNYVDCLWYTKSFYYQAIIKLLIVSNFFLPQRS